MGKKRTAPKQDAPDVLPPFVRTEPIAYSFVPSLKQWTERMSRVSAELVQRIKLWVTV